MDQMRVTDVTERASPGPTLDTEMPQCQGFTAWITIDGETAEEYDLETSEDGKTMTCWIASQLAKKFSVHCRAPPLACDIGGYVDMDGTKCGGQTLRATTQDRHFQKNGVSDGTIIRPFMFSSLQVTDDDTFLSSSSHQDLGRIRFSITPIRVAGVSAAPPTSLSQVTVHERSKKAVTQQVAGTRAIPAAWSIC
ncbi:hypothetical protein C8R47DRAFT_86666 [Mycena vitilis]|nr:hypothetical protein C8R47DRAFT_86666 [Mycena vitilis]